MYLSLDLIMKSEEPMVFSNCKDRPRIIMHNYEQEQAEKSASFEYYIQHYQILLFVLLRSSQTSAFPRLHIGT